MSERTMRIWRGDANGGEFVDYKVDVDEGMVVLDVIHRVQSLHANDLGVRWNCKAGKCGSCSMEINGKPKLSCMTRMNEYGHDEVISVQPLKTFPVIKIGSGVTIGLVALNSLERRAAAKARSKSIRASWLSSIS